MSSILKGKLRNVEEQVGYGSERETPLILNPMFKQRKIKELWDGRELLADYSDKNCHQ